MKLIRAHVRNFQSVRDSTSFEVKDVTCLVGKNESGKTAILQALYWLNPINPGEGKYDVTDDYPRDAIDPAKLTRPRVVSAIEEQLQTTPLKSGSTFNHYRPARYFVENVATLSSQIFAATLTRFEAVFKQLNKLLPK